MHIIRAADCRRMPWKNGGGETIEIAISPEGAGLDDFDWRLSMARVEDDGPFSLFTGVDRTLAILEGEGLVLSVGGQDPVRLTDRSAPCSFPADVETSSSLIAGPITDLNMMTRRSRFGHSMRRLMARGTSTPVVEADEILLFCRNGAVEVGSDASLHLGPLETLHMRKAAGALQIKAIEPAELFLIEIAKAF
ncbi:HutD family protein [Mesorhizobium sp. WSM2239]|uniref:HutD family protein n=2 Tax=unclassified Mesorhizobium TaxID=325217 RepID=A0AAU8D1F5_9HYPH